VSSAISNTEPIVNLVTGEDSDLDDTPAKRRKETSISWYGKYREGLALFERMDS